MARRTKSREKILGAATELFLVHGYLGTSMDAVTEAADVSKQTVYVHFGTKENLFLSIVDHMVGGATKAHQELLPVPDGSESLRDFLARFAREELAIVITPRLMQIRRLAIAESARFPELGRRLFALGPQASIDQLTRVFRVYAERGALRPCDPAEAARHFNWLVMGGPTSEAMLLGDASFPDAAQQARHADECARIFCAAYASDP